MEYIELSCKTEQTIISPRACLELDLDAWINLDVGIWLTGLDDNGDFIKSPNIGEFKAAFCIYDRRHKAHTDLFTEFDREYPELCGLIPGWERNGKWITTNNGWREGVEGTIRNPQACKVVILYGLKIDDAYTGMGYDLEALAIYIDAFCDDDDIILMPIHNPNYDGCNSIEDVQLHFKPLGFLPAAESVLVKDNNYECDYQYKDL